MGMTEKEIDKAIDREFGPMMEQIQNYLTEFAEQQAAAAKQADAEAKRKAREYFSGRE